MGRKKLTDQKRRIVKLATTITTQEAREYDKRRGVLSRGTQLHLLVNDFIRKEI
jgi:hypothetical protein